MTKEKYEETTTSENNKDAAVQPDPETLNTTDPQDHMKGPISSLMHSTKEGFEHNGSEEEVEATKKD